jgi:hypothetical protein
MESSEKALFHQVHPAKLVTDWSTSLVAAAFLWQHQLLAALLVGLVPPVVASILVIRFADLERLKASPAGRYVGRYMTRSMELVRSAGAGAFWAAAWFHSPWAMAIGIGVIVLAWARGRLWPGSAGLVRERD